MHAAGIAPTLRAGGVCKRASKVETLECSMPLASRRLTCSGAMAGLRVNCYWNKIRCWLIYREYVKPRTMDMYFIHVARCREGGTDR